MVGVAFLAGPGSGPVIAAVFGAVNRMIAGAWRDAMATAAVAGGHEDAAPPEGGY